MLTPTYYPIIGGAETMVQRLAIELNLRQIRTDILTFNMDKVWSPKWRGKTEISNQGFHIFKVPAFNWTPMISASRFKMGVNLVPGRFRNLLKFYDILHYHVGDISFPLFSLSSRQPKVCQLHGLDYDAVRRSFPSRFILNHTGDVWLTPTEQMKNDLTRLGVGEQRIIRLPNSIDASVFHPAGKKEDNLLLFVGRIHPGKGLHVLLNSLHYLKQAVRLVIIGPPAWNSEYFNRLLKTIEKINLEGQHRVEYIGEKSQEDVVRWCQRASIFVLPPVAYEALGIVNLEALACETPVVATDVGGISEAVHNGENGLLVKPNDPVKLASAIQYLLSNESIRRRFGEEGRKLVMTTFSTDAVVLKLIMIYERLLASKSYIERQVANA
jgi:glycosyltransferase involved in cell wall biosynthesis